MPCDTPRTQGITAIRSSFAVLSRPSDTTIHWGPTGMRSGLSSEANNKACDPSPTFILCFWAPVISETLTLTAGLQQKLGRHLLIHIFTPDYSFLASERVDPFFGPRLSKGSPASPPDLVAVQRPKALISRVRFPDNKPFGDREQRTLAAPTKSGPNLLVDLLYLKFKYLFNNKNSTKYC